MASQSQGFHLQMAIRLNLVNQIACIKRMPSAFSIGAD